MLRSLLTGFIIGLLIMTRALGIAALAALICLFIFTILKYRKISNLKYLLTFLPFIPAILIGFIFYSNKIFSIGYSGAHFDILTNIFTDYSNFVTFFRLALNEMNYFIIMSYTFKNMVIKL